MYKGLCTIVWFNIAYIQHMSAAGFSLHGNPRIYRSPCNVDDTLPSLQHRPISQTVQTLATETLGLKIETDELIEFINVTEFSAIHMWTRTLSGNISGLVQAATNDLASCELNEMSLLLQSNYRTLSTMSRYMSIITRDMPHEIGLKSKYRRLCHAINNLRCSIEIGLGIDSSISHEMTSGVPREISNPSGYQLFRDFRLLLDLSHLSGDMHTVYNALKIFIETDC